METRTIVLGGREYHVRELPLRKNSEWRQRLQAELTDLVGTVSDAPELELASMGDVRDLVQSVGGQLIGSVDQVTDLLFAYSPEILADSERIESEAYESEIIDGFMAVLGLAFPFGKWAGKLGAMAREVASTSAGSPTATSSAYPNGADIAINSTQ